MGRGKGFETVGEYSVESFPELLQSLRKRVNRISNILGLNKEGLVLQLQRENRELINRLNTEVSRRVMLEEELEEQDTGYIIHKISMLTGEGYSDINSAVDSLINRHKQILASYNNLNDEYVETVEYINEILPEEHPEYDELGEAVEALVQVYEDELEELEDSL